MAAGEAGQCVQNRVVWMDLAVRQHRMWQRSGGEAGLGMVLPVALGGPQTEVRRLEGVLQPRAEWKPLGLGKYYGGGEVKLVG